MKLHTLKYQNLGAQKIFQAEKTRIVFQNVFAHVISKNSNPWHHFVLYASTVYFTVFS
jgi:hypothetical protein